LDTFRNIFGGFTPVEWESLPRGAVVGDESLKTFVFTLKNPHKLAPRKFPLNPRWKHQALCSSADDGPCFGLIKVSNRCDTSAESTIFLYGDTYINDTSLDLRVVFTGTIYFGVREIEVFELTDSRRVS
jgi:hypothetical protein